MAMIFSLIENFIHIILVGTLLTEALKELLQIILPIILLVERFDNLVLKYVAAVNVVVWSFDTMLIISKWPGKFKQINIGFLNDIIHKMHLIFIY